MSLINYGALERRLYFRLPTNTHYENDHEYVNHVEVCDCTGVTIGNSPHMSIYLRTSTEMRCAADWLRTLWDKPVPLLIKGCSPEFSDESIPDVYDATDLQLDCWMTKGRKPRLHIGSHRPYRGAIILRSREATAALSEGLAELAERFDDPKSDLFKSI